MESIVEWLVTAAIALVGGTVGGVILAPKISLRTEQGRRQYAANDAIRSALKTYRSTLAYMHSEIAIKRSYTAEYAHPKGQESLAEAVVRELDYLPRKRRDLLLRLLVILVGKGGVSAADDRASVPAHVRSAEADESWLLDRIATHVQSGDLTGLGDGQLGRVMKDPMDDEAYEAAIATLDAMSSLCPPIRDKAPLVTITELRRRKAARNRILKHASSSEHALRSTNAGDT